MTGPTVIRTVGRADLGAWVAMRAVLWPEDPLGRLRVEARAFLDGRGLAQAYGRAVPSCVLIAVDGEDRPIGFIEASLRNVVDGCGPGPVGYLEGWYVAPEYRRAGVGRALVRAAERWARGLGCTEMGSDALVENLVSEAAHRALGYRVVDRSILFRRSIARVKTVGSNRTSPAG